MISSIPRRTCDTCGTISTCYLAGGGWNCSGCAMALVVTHSLASTLETLAEIASDGPMETKNLAQALRRGAANPFWGVMLQDMADKVDAIAAGHETREERNGSTSGTKDTQMDQTGRELLDKVRSVAIKYRFPDLATAFQKGGELGPGLDNQNRELHDAYVRRCEVLSYVPCKCRESKVPDEQRWAVNYLRHECSSYEDVCGRLQDEARERLASDSPRPDWEGFYATSEMIHQVVKNRVQRQIAAQFPELADAACEQMV